MKKQKSVRPGFTIMIIALLFVATTLYTRCSKGAGASTIPSQSPDTQNPIRSSIIYTNLAPDTELVNPGTIPNSSGEYNIDVNNDGVYDFDFKILYSNHCAPDCSPGKKFYVLMNPFTGSLNEILDTTNTSFPHPLDSAAMIAASRSPWSNASPQILGESSTCCMAIASPAFGTSRANAKYIGVRLKVNSSTYYGWIRLIVDGFPSSGRLTILDYAYNSIAQQPIFAGQMK